MAESQGRMLRKLHSDLEDLQEHFHALLRVVQRHDPTLHAKVCHEKFKALRKRCPAPAAPRRCSQSPLTEVVKRPAALARMCHGRDWGQLKQSSTCCRRRMEQRLYAFGGLQVVFGGVAVKTAVPVKTAECLDLAKGEWAPLPCMRFARGGCTAAALGDSILICGGVAPLGRVVDKYCTKTGKWDFKVPSLKEPRCMAAAAVLGGRMYVCGGVDNADNVHRSMESFKPVPGEKGEWRMEGDMMEARRNMGVVGIKGSLVICGGESVPISHVLKEHVALCSAEEAVGPTKGWLPPMKVPRASPGTAALKATLYVCGGETDFVGHRSVECFSFEAGSWSMVAPMKLGRYGCAAVACGDALYVMGGCRQSQPVGSHSPAQGSVERYDPEVNSWEFIVGMLEGRCLSSAVAL